MTEKKSKKDTKENVLDTQNKQEVIKERTVVLRDQFGELVLTSTNEKDTFKEMLETANAQKKRQSGNPLINIPAGPRSYHG